MKRTLLVLIAGPGCLLLAAGATSAQQFTDQPDSYPSGRFRRINA